MGRAGRAFRERSVTALARLTVRLMDRTRSVDEFEMATMQHDPALLVLEASSFALRLGSRANITIGTEDLARAAIELAYDQALADGFTVRTRILKEGWLLLVRVDRRTGPATIAPLPYGLPLAA